MDGKHLIQNEIRSLHIKIFKKKCLKNNWIYSIFFAYLYSYLLEMFFAKFQDSYKKFQKFFKFFNRIFQRIKSEIFLTL